MDKNTVRIGVAGLVMIDENPVLNIEAQLFSPKNIEKEGEL